MQRNLIPTTQLAFSPLGLWASTWGLLAAGDFAKGHFNSMTVSWGSTGIMWGKPFVMVVVRPTRYTYKFINEADSFTLSVFGPEHRPALELLGSKSGRDMDKVGHSGLTPMASTQVASPSFDEAELILECRKMYFSDFDPQHFQADFINSLYSNDYHRMYFGEIVAAMGTAKYSAKQ